jgi:hypothetical protein
MRLDSQNYLALKDWSVVESILAPVAKSDYTIDYLQAEQCMVDVLVQCELVPPYLKSWKQAVHMVGVHARAACLSVYQAH